MMVSVGMLAEFEAEMAGLDDPSACADTAERLLRSTTTVRRQIQVAESRLIAILDRHAVEGAGVAPEDVLTDEGMSGREARAAAGRGRTQNDLGRALLDEGNSGGCDHGDRRGHAPVDEASDRHRDDDDEGDTLLTLPELNPENLEALSRAARSFDLPAEQELFATHRADLARMAAVLDPTTFKVRLKALVAQIRAAVATTTEERHKKATKISSWVNRDGMRVIHGEYDRERGDAIWAAIEREKLSLAANADRSDGEALTLGPNLAAEALFQLTSRGFDPAAKTSRPLIGVLVDEDTLAGGLHDGSIIERMGDAGSRLSEATLRRFLCDADLQALVMGGTEPLAVGRTYRTATNAQRLALRAIYDACSFPGCDVPFEWCHIHHLDWWEHGGVTDLDNLTPLCNRHHHVAHEGGWELKLRPGRVLEVVRPDGTPHASATADGVVTRWCERSDAQRDDARGDDERVHHREPTNN